MVSPFFHRTKLFWGCRWINVPDA